MFVVAFKQAHPLTCVASSVRARIAAGPLFWFARFGFCCCFVFCPAARAVTVGQPVEWLKTLARQTASVPQDRSAGLGQSRTRFLAGTDASGARFPFNLPHICTPPPSPHHSWSWLLRAKSPASGGNASVAFNLKGARRDLVLSYTLSRHCRHKAGTNTRNTPWDTQQIVIRARSRDGSSALE